MTQTFDPKWILAKIGCAYSQALEGVKSHVSPDTPKQLTFLISVVLAIAAVVVRYLVYTGVQLPPLFPAGGFLLLLIAYLVLVAGNVLEGA